jgi:hypothetical protein
MPTYAQQNPPYAQQYQQSAQQYQPNGQQYQQNEQQFQPAEQQNQQYQQSEQQYQQNDQQIQQSEQQYQQSEQQYQPGANEGQMPVQLSKPTAASSIDSPMGFSAQPYAPQFQPQMPRAKAQSALPPIHMDTLASFVKSFIKDPAGTLRSSFLGLSECIILLGIRTIALIVVMIVIGYNMFDRSGMLIEGAANVFSAISELNVGLIIVLGLVSSVALSAVFYGITYIIGKSAFKGEFDTKKDFVKVFTGIESALMPFTVLIFVGSLFNLFAPMVAVALGLFGLVFSMIASPAVFEQLYKLDRDKSTYTAILSFGIFAILMALI